MVAAEKAAVDKRATTEKAAIKKTAEQEERCLVKTSKTKEVAITRTKPAQTHNADDVSELLEKKPTVPAPIKTWSVTQNAAFVWTRGKLAVTVPALVTRNKWLLKRSVFLPLTGGLSSLLTSARDCWPKLPFA